MKMKRRRKEQTLLTHKANDKEMLLFSCVFNTLLKTFFLKKSHQLARFRSILNHYNFKWSRYDED
jgi:hypothetical protein